MGEQIRDTVGYAPAGTVLQEVEEEKDIGVIVSNILKPAAQCAKAAKKANSIVGQMSMNSWGVWGRCKPPQRCPGAQPLEAFPFLHYTTPSSPGN